MDPVVDRTLRGALALLFLVAAAHKLRAPVAFRAQLADYRLVPGRATQAVAAAVVAGELTTGLAFIAPPLRVAAAGAALVLLCAYSFAIALNLMRGRRDIDCGCSGLALRQPLTPWLLARNAVLAGIAVVCLAPVRDRTLLWVDAVTVLGGVGVLAALYAASNRMLANAPALARLRSS
ncbi:MAG TPA: MauE/DoxX family redox-associated membrane protein [Myxococcota bacterium]|nr:MauE/DoxX family redox-associated membrane protein [Myxococcota bacterium]